MATYIVGLRLDGENGDEIIQRLSKLKLADAEGVLSISAQPEMVNVPDELRAESAAPMQNRPPPQRIAPVQ